MAENLPYEFTPSDEEEQRAKKTGAVGDGNAAVDASERIATEALGTTGIHHPSVNTDMGILESIGALESTAETLEEAQANAAEQQAGADQTDDVLDEISALP